MLQIPDPGSVQIFSVDEKSISSNGGNPQMMPQMNAGMMINGDVQMPLMSPDMMLPPMCVDMPMPHMNMVEQPMSESQTAVMEPRQLTNAHQQLNSSAPLLFGNPPYLSLDQGMENNGHVGHDQIQERGRIDMSPGLSPFVDAPVQQIVMVQEDQLMTSMQHLESIPEQQVVVQNQAYPQVEGGQVVYVMQNFDEFQPVQQVMAQQTEYEPVRQWRSYSHSPSSGPLSTPPSGNPRSGGRPHVPPATQTNRFGMNSPGHHGPQSKAGKPLPPLITKNEPCNCKFCVEYQLVEMGKLIRNLIDHTEGGSVSITDICTMPAIYELFRRRLSGTLDSTIMGKLNTPACRRITFLQAESLPSGVVTVKKSPGTPWWEKSSPASGSGIHPQKTTELQSKITDIMQEHTEMIIPAKMLNNLESIHSILEGTAALFDYAVQFQEVPVNFQVKITDSDFQIEKLAKGAGHRQIDIVAEALNKAWSKISGSFGNKPCPVTQVADHWGFQQIGRSLALILEVRPPERAGSEPVLFISSIEGEACQIPVNVFLIWANVRGTQKNDDGSWRRLVERFPSVEHIESLSGGRGVHSAREFLVNFMISAEVTLLPDRKGIKYDESAWIKALKIENSQASTSSANILVGRVSSGMSQIEELIDQACQDQHASVEGDAPMRYRGKVLSWSSTMNWGFVQTDDIDEDIFLSASKLTPGTHAVDIYRGRLIEFSLFKNYDGQKCAVNVCFLSHLLQDGPRKRGIVKSFNFLKGWGFLYSEMASEGKDVYINKAALMPGVNINSLQPGAIVEFTLCVTHDENPQASKCMVVDDNDLHTIGLKCPEMDQNLNSKSKKLIKNSRVNLRCLSRSMAMLLRCGVAELKKGDANDPSQDQVPAIVKEYRQIAQKVCPARANMVEEILTCFNNRQTNKIPCNRNRHDNRLAVIAFLEKNEIQDLQPQMIEDLHKMHPDEIMKYGADLLKDIIEKKTSIQELSDAFLKFREIGKVSRQAMALIWITCAEFMCRRDISSVVLSRGAITAATVVCHDELDTIQSACNRFIKLARPTKPTRHTQRQVLTKFLSSEKVNSQLLKESSFEEAYQIWLDYTCAEEPGFNDVEKHFAFSCQIIRFLFRGGLSVVDSCIQMAFDQVKPDKFVSKLMHGILRIAITEMVYLALPDLPPLVIMSESSAVAAIMIGHETLQMMNILRTVQTLSERGVLPRADILVAEQNKRKRPSASPDRPDKMAKNNHGGGESFLETLYRLQDNIAASIDTVKVDISDNTISMREEAEKFMKNMIKGMHVILGPSGKNPSVIWQNLQLAFSSFWGFRSNTRFTMLSPEKILTALEQAQSFVAEAIVVESKLDLESNSRSPSEPIVK